MYLWEGRGEGQRERKGEKKAEGEREWGGDGKEMKRGEEKSGRKKSVLLYLLKSSKQF